MAASDESVWVAQRPSSPRSRSDQAANTRELLLDAAAIEFMRRGVAGTRIEDIAHRAGVTRGALYFHFRTVENMARELLTSASEQRAELFFDEPDSDGTRGLPAARALTWRVMLKAATDPRMLGTLRVAAELDDKAELPAFFRTWESQLMRPLQQSIADHVLREEQDVRDTAFSIVRCAWGILLLHVVMDESEDMEVEFARVWNRLTSGICASVGS
ncbi:TetR family transcriptional regulator [Microbacterium sp.]|uniref:TetR family transcriptional regulator n=1 Tax=Microbacterium sp. TaxID=51671 RepID=UPI003A91EF0E